MKIFLHACCGDCLVRFLVAIGYPLSANCQSFVKNYDTLPTRPWPDLKLHVVYLNPNIYPKSEYYTRLQCVRMLTHLLDLPLTIADYRPQDYFSLPATANKLQNITSAIASNRCFQCQKLRLEQTIATAYAKSHERITFSTTMLASRYLNQKQIKSISQDLATQNNANFWQPDFLNDPQSLRTSGYFKQNYCGCLFSLIEKTQAKYLPANQK